MSIAKISVIPKQYSAGNSLENALGQRGWSRMPGTGVSLFPYANGDGTYRTGLNEKDPTIERIEDPTEKKRRVEEILKLRKKLELASGLDLSPHSKWWNFGSSRRQGDTVEPFRLVDDDNIFNLDIPLSHITYLWLSNHPGIAKSLEAYKAGLAPSSCQFYVKNEEAEAGIIYAQKKLFNDTFIKFNSFSPDKKKKVARLCNLPAFDNTREEIVYNMMDEFLRSKEIRDGIYKGGNPVSIFNMYADLDDNSLYVKDLVEQCFKNTLYKLGKNGRIYQGQEIVFNTKDELLEFFLQDKNQPEVLLLANKLKTKLLASV